MSKEEYLGLLKGNLYDIPQEEINNIMQYYSEYFEDAGQENEQNIMSELGSPIELAAKIRSDFQTGNGQYDSRYQNTNATKKSNTTTIILIIVAIIGSPLWLPLGIAAFAVAFSIGITIVALAGSFVIAGAAVFISGLASLGVGLYSLFTDIATGVMLSGSGLVLTGVGMFVLLLDIWIVVWISRLVRMIFGKLKSSRQDRKDIKAGKEIESNEKVY